MLYSYICQTSSLSVCSLSHETVEQSSVEKCQGRAEWFCALHCGRNKDAGLQWDARFEEKPGSGFWWKPNPGYVCGCFPTMLHSRETFTLMWIGRLCGLTTCCIPCSMLTSKNFLDCFRLSKRLQLLTLCCHFG